MSPKQMVDFEIIWKWYKVTPSLIDPIFRYDLMVQYLKGKPEAFDPAFLAKLIQKKTMLQTAFAGIGNICWRNMMRMILSEFLKSTSNISDVIECVTWLLDFSNDSLMGSDFNCDSICAYVSLVNVCYGILEMKSSVVDSMAKLCLAKFRQDESLQNCHFVSECIARLICQMVKGGLSCLELEDFCCGNNLDLAAQVVSDTRWNICYGKVVQKVWDEFKATGNMNLLKCLEKGAEQGFTYEKVKEYDFVREYLLAVKDNCFESFSGNCVSTLKCITRKLPQSLSDRDNIRIFKFILSRFNLWHLRLLDNDMDELVENICKVRDLSPFVENRISCLLDLISPFLDLKNVYILLQTNPNYAITILKNLNVHSQQLFELIVDIVKSKGNVANCHLMESCICYFRKWGYRVPNDILLGWIQDSETDICIAAAKYIQSIGFETFPDLHGAIKERLLRVDEDVGVILSFIAYFRENSEIHERLANHTDKAIQRALLKSVQVDELDDFETVFGCSLAEVKSSLISPIIEAPSKIEFIDFYCMGCY